jgi:hypothetical protein
MSGHRVELRVTFTVSDGNDGGRIAAEALVQELVYVGEHYHTGDFELTRGTVDGLGWNEVWPQTCPARLYIPGLYGDLAVPVSGEAHWLPCDIPPGEKHPIVKDPTARTEWSEVHRAGRLWWADRSVPEDGDD